MLYSPGGGSVPTIPGDPTLGANPPNPPPANGGVGAAGVAPKPGITINGANIDVGSWVGLLDGLVPSVGVDTPVKTKTRVIGLR